MVKFQNKVKYKVLDKGFVSLVDFMGGDDLIEQAARISYQGRKKTEQRALIRYLMRNAHWSPFEMTEFVFHVKLPLYVQAQVVRHRQASINQVSYRYTEINDDINYLPYERYTKQSIDNKQGSSDEKFLSEDEYVKFNVAQTDLNNCQLKYYHELLENGCAREIARIHLPQSVYTEAFWKMDLRNLLNFLKLRIDPHAQKEVRDYAVVIAAIVKEKCPLVWEAFEDYILYAQTFTQDELEILNSDYLTWDGVESNLLTKGYSKREITELKNKLEPAKKIDIKLGDVYAD